MYEYRVGTLYHPKRTQWEEGTQFNWRSNSLLVELFFKHPKPVEIQAVKQGEATFGLVVKDDVILLAFKLGVLSWSDASYTWHRIPTDQNALPSLELRPHGRQLLTVFLIDAGTGILLAIRQVTLSHEFTVALFQAIVEQAQRPFDQVRYDRQLRQIYAHHDSRSLFRLASVTCKGGD